MSYEIPFDHFDPENPDDRPVPGKYHVLIQSVDDADPEKSITVDYEILAGSVPNQEGKTGREYLSRSPKAAKRVALFSVATGIADIKAMIEAKRNGTPYSLDLGKAEGRQCVVELVKKDQYVNWSFQGVWPVDDEAVKDVPKNEGMIGQTGGGDDDDTPF